MVVFSNFSNFTDVSNYYQNAAGPKALGLRLACYTTVGNRFQALCLSPCLFVCLMFIWLHRVLVVAGEIFSCGM